MSFVQTAGDAAECPLSLFVNPGRNRVPQTVGNEQVAGEAVLPRLSLTVS
jgi:hypothetical protein